MSIDKDFRRSIVGALVLELGPSGQRRPRSGEYVEMMEGGSMMEGSLRRKKTSGKSDVMEDDVGKVRCGGGFELDSRSYGFLEKSSWYLGHVSSS